MPTYQYACTECGERLEAVQSFSDPALTECPACQGKLRKVFNSVGIVFKGSGFYRNDSRDKPAAESSSSPNETKTEPKDAPKDAPKKDAPKTETTAKTETKTKTESKPAASTTTSSSSS